MLTISEGAKVMGFLSRTTGYVVTERRVFIAVNAAAAIGAVLLTLFWASLAKPLELMSAYFFAHLIWFFAIACLGGPVWIVMHRFGLRHWVHAGLAGGVVLGIACMALMTGFFTGHSNSLQSATRSAGQWIWIDYHLTAEGWFDAIKSSLWISPLGVILGLVIWRIAYRRVSA